MKSDTLQAILFGRYTNLVYPKGRSQTLNMPLMGEGGGLLQIEWRSDDGLIPTLLKRIDALEKKNKPQTP